VKDNGIGISQENLPLIFDRFYQAESARTKNNSNSFGLGLAIAKEISKQLNAQLTVSSKVAKSTTFTLTLC
jgi:signal transduction histidine kinase